MAPTRRWSLERPAAAFLATYAALWASTLAGAAGVTLAGAVGKHAVRRLLALTLTARQNPPPTIGRVLALAAHNLPIAAWPLLLGLAGTASSQRGKRAADSLILACALANTIPVGAALAAYGTPLLRYVPQLPLEWAALATGYGSWATQRKRAISRRERVAWLAATALLAVAAATIETVAVPHRSAADSSTASATGAAHNARAEVRELKPQRTNRETVQATREREWYFASRSWNNGCGMRVRFVGAQGL